MEYHDGIRIFDATATARAFPLGGIGTGNVSLGARGSIDWLCLRQARFLSVTGQVRKGRPLLVI